MKQELIGLSQQNVTELRENLAAFGRVKKDARKKSGYTTMEYP